MSQTNLFRGELIETDDSGELQTAKGYGYAGEEVAGVHVVRQHGLASHAPKGSHGIGIAGSGERSLVAFLGMEHQDKRPKGLAEGNTTLYDAAGNATRMLGADGIWHDAADRPHKMTGKTVAVIATENASIGGKKTYLGGDGTDGTYSPVMTAAGPSSTVFAKV
ncbi:phage baseplate assembly protein [Methylobacterium sp. E-041]|uniref:phage baseplate assembly protein domain-containing protein n=1 Tax=Methylobacterium sp. E-041 TaxID=2836573 RepID=UPI001FB94061|nr:phage baseplate assembly protein [Methylobacterium sp. E-041]MCJ2108023.1 phage baseplate assembly protein [Methylobacterium sp. E-041]